MQIMMEIILGQFDTCNVVWCCGLVSPHTSHLLPTGEIEPRTMSVYMFTRHTLSSLLSPLLMDCASDCSGRQGNIFYQSIFIKVNDEFSYS